MDFIKSIHVFFIVLFFTIILSVTASAKDNYIITLPLDSVILQERYEGIPVDRLLRKLSLNIKELLDNDELSYDSDNVAYLLPKANGYDIVLAWLDAGTHSYLYLLIFKDKSVLNKLILEAAYGDDENPDNFYVDTKFKISKDYIIKITTNSTVEGKKEPTEVVNIKIDKDGALIDLQTGRGYENE